jgi:uncharacterized protein
MTDAKFDIPFKSPNVPTALTADTRLQFDCFPGIACFNACCRQADVTLAPYDILRLKRRLGLTSTAFLKAFTVPFAMDADGLPGVKLKTQDNGSCLQLAGDAGCGVYADRPTVCRYYPVALLALREKGAAQAQERYSLVKEDHCLGHAQPRALTIGDYRTEQGCPEYDDHNREWYQLLLKKQSAGPAVGKPPQTSLQLFFMASYDLDSFRRFVLSAGFRGAYVFPDAFYASVEQDDEALLAFAYRFLRQVLFGERTLEEVVNAWEQRVEGRKDRWEARKQVEIERRLAAEDRKYAEDGGETQCGDR